MERARLVIASGREGALGRRHPWVFSGAVKRIEGNPQDGDIVDVVDSHGVWMATGYYQEGESIICKVLSFDTLNVDEDFFGERFRSALEYRKRLGFFDYFSQSLDLERTDVFRLVHGEGDGLPGLVCDWYNGVVVMQAYSEGMHRLFPLFTEIWKGLLGERLQGVFDKSSATCKNNHTDGYLFCDQNMLTIDQTQVTGHKMGEWEITEGGRRMLINFFEGQKTGFFIDQRENRGLVQQLAKGHRVLNCFGYTGGFSLAALRGGAEFVETVDISKKAIELCNRNVELNDAQSRHRGTVADVLKYLDQFKSVPEGAVLSGQEPKFDLIILDPPAFAKSHRNLQSGLKGYHSINQRAIEALPKGGLLMTFSCSQAVSKDDFQTMIFSAAINANRGVRIVRQLPHAADHPVSIYHPEGEYLKGLLLEVE
ncbi:MAG: class I SAM-dependent rRNA methyltransferase [Bacteroidales bacterium]|nr:class I SAM-dependent rRNA methyltransferase [Bacteroidales bacterium]